MKPSFDLVKDDMNLVKSADQDKARNICLDAD